MTEQFIDLNWLSERLSAFSIQNDDAFVEYIAGIASDVTIDEDEKRSSLHSFLEDASSDPVDDLVTAIIDHALQAKQKADEAAEKARLEAKAQREEEEKRALAALEEKQREQASSSSQHKELSREERKRREALLMQYGYDLDEIVERADGEVEILYKDRSSQGKTKLPGLEENRNAKIVAEKEAMQRQKHREEHLKQQARIKEQQEREKQKKEQEKRRTQKKEKVRM